MSRLAKRPIPIVSGTSLSVNDRVIVVQRGSASVTVPLGVGVSVQSSGSEVRVLAEGASANSAQLGLTWSLLFNAVKGVSEPFVRLLELQGVGYQATIEKNCVVLAVGFANKVRLPIPAGVTAACSDATHIKISGADQQVVGQFAANVRKVRPPEPYKGKGIRYVGEVVRRKAGKAFGAK